MKVLDLFSGIGAFSLGLERAGMTTVAFAEIDPYCRRVLAKHWPEIPCYDDVRSLTADRLRADGISVDVICGGFPCQDISVAGRGAGLAGERSGLWSEFARLIGEIRPRYVIVENVAALLGRGLGDVLGDMAALGYGCVWHCIPASAVGAPHIRDRVWVIAYPDSAGRSRSRPTQPAGWWDHPVLAGSSEALADAECAGSHGSAWRGLYCEGRATSITASLRQSIGGQWEPEAGICRVAHGVASRVDRLRGLGNSLVPQIPELIGRAILAATAVPKAMAA